MDGDLERLYSRVRPRLVRLATLLIDDSCAAEDVVQDVFASLVSRNLEGVSDSYLISAVLNRSKSVLRHRLVVRRALARLGGQSSEVDTVLDNDLNATLAPVWRAVSGLPLRQKQVVICRFWLDYSERDTARTLGISEGTVKKCCASTKGVSRCLKRVMTHFLA